MRSIIGLIVLLLISFVTDGYGQDTIWFKNGEITVCTINDIQAEKKKVVYTPFSGIQRTLETNLIDRYSWGGYLFQGTKDWRNAEPREFPNLNKLENGTYGKTVLVPFDEADIERVLQHLWENSNSWDLVIPTIVSGHYKSESELLFDIDTSEPTGSTNSKWSTVWMTFKVSFSVASNGVAVSCGLQYANSKLHRKLYSDGVYELFENNYRKKNGQVKEFNYYAAERANHTVGQLISSLVARLKEYHIIEVAQEHKKDAIRDFQTDFKKYLSTLNIHPLEGIWSVDVRIDEDHDFNFTSQAFQIGIKRFGDGFISIPLQLGTPQYERSVKVFQRTAEPNVFLMQGYFPDHDYISTATVYQKSDGVVDFSMQLPKAEVRRIAKAYSSTYDGDLKLTYRLIKVFPMPDTDVTEKDEEEPEHWTATGSGFAVSNNGLVATNYHVIEGGKTIHVRGVNGKNNQKLIAEVVARDKQKDLAILKITDKNFTKTTELPYSLSTIDEKMGAEVFSLGFPKPGVFGDGLIFTDGKVSATKGLLGNEVNYQMTVPITFGNSGGPIFNKLGQIIGVSVAGTLDVELLTASYSVKSKYLVDLLKTVTDYTPVSQKPSTTSLEDQIEAYKNFVYLIEVSSEQ